RAARGETPRRLSWGPDTRGGGAIEPVAGLAHRRDRAFLIEAPDLQPLLDLVQQHGDAGDLILQAAQERLPGGAVLGALVERVAQLHQIAPEAAARRRAAAGDIDRARGFLLDEI